MSQSFEIDARGFFELVGEACGLLLLGFCFLVMVFCL